MSYLSNPLSPPSFKDEVSSWPSHNQFCLSFLSSMDSRNTALYLFDTDNTSGMYSDSYGPGPTTQKRLQWRFSTGWTQVTESSGNRKLLEYFFISIAHGGPAHAPSLQRALRASISTNRKSRVFSETYIWHACHIGQRNACHTAWWSPCCCCRRIHCTGAGGTLRQWWLLSAPPC